MPCLASVHFILYWSTVIFALVIYGCMILYLQMRPGDEESPKGGMNEVPAPTSSLLRHEEVDIPEKNIEDWQKEWKDQIARLDLSPERKSILLQKLMNSQRFSNKGE